MDLAYLKKLVRIVEHSGVDEIEVEEEGLRVRIARNPHTNSVGVHSSAPAPALQVPAQAAAPAPATAAEKPEANYHEVKSPIVGTFYRSAEPGAPAFVEIGSIVKKGQVLCIIEAMKLMNEIDSEYDGEVASVYVENGQPVQYGERLFAIKTA